jgi:hypothetical protein
VPPTTHEPGHNPFATRYVRPGAVAYLFPPDCSTEQLVERLRANGWWGQIVGAHGSGKSSLLAALTPALAAERCVILFALHDGQRRLGSGWRERKPLGASSLVVVDGYEQLSGWSKFRLKWLCRRRSAGLLVTAHTDVGLPTLFDTATDLPTAQLLVARLLTPGDETIGMDDVARVWQTRAGDLREALFDLYNLYEQRRGAGQSEGTA